MGFSVKLQMPVGFDIRWFLPAAAGALLAAFLLWMLRTRKAAGPAPQTAAGGGAPDFSGETAAVPLEEKYLLILEALRKEYGAGKVDEREACQQLSRIMRAFASEKTGQRADRATLSEIRGMNMPSLEKLIGVYYEPEFAENAGIDVNASIDQAEEVIKLWN